MNAAHLDIAELADVCAEMYAENMGLFRELGAWAATDDDPARQRWFATACHRHVWHAELWAHRAPVIPGAPVLNAASAGESTSVLGRSPDADVYRRHLESMSVRNAGLERRVDGDLDPSTQRVLTLIGRDLADLLGD